MTMEATERLREALEQRSRCLEAVATAGDIETGQALFRRAVTLNKLAQSFISEGVERTALESSSRPPPHARDRGLVGACETW
jgi:hypothetical protein